VGRSCALEEGRRRRWQLVDERDQVVRTVMARENVAALEHEHMF
jgi:hypothetical protein